MTSASVKRLASGKVYIEQVQVALAIPTR